MNAKPKTELNISVFMQKRSSVNGALGILEHKIIYYCPRLGRKFTIIPALAIASISCVIVAFIPTNKGQGQYLKVMCPCPCKYSSFAGGMAISREISRDH